MQTCLTTLRSLSAIELHIDVCLRLDDLVRMHNLRTLRAEFVASIHLHSRTATSRGVDQLLSLVELKFHAPLAVDTPTVLTE